MKSDAAELQALLSEGDDLTAAALLVAIYNHPNEPTVAPEDADVLARLVRLQCVAGGSCTPLGAKVAIRLMAAGIVDDPDF